MTYHRKCIDLTNDECDLIASKKSKLKWFCYLCDPHVTDILSNMEKFKKMNNELNKIKNEMDEKMNNFEIRLNKMESDRENPNITSVVKKVVSENFPNAENMEEKALIEKKKCNLIYFRIPESSNENIEDRMKYDFERFKEMYGEQNVDSHDIMNIYRIGKRKPEHSRPLIIIFKDYETKNEYVKRSFGKELHVKQNNEIIKIAVTHDKTENQRKEAKKRYDEGKSNGRNFQNETSGTKKRWADIVKDLH